MQDDHPETTVRAHYRGGAYNRRVAAETENLQRLGLAGDDPVELLCTCGRPDCDEILLLSLAEYDRVRMKPYRFVIAPGHDASVDDVIAHEDEYWVIEVKPRFRPE